MVFFSFCSSSGSRVGTQVAAPDQSFVVLVDGDAGGGADEGDADDVVATADLAVDSLERVGEAQLRPVVGGDKAEASRFSSHLFYERGDLRQLPARPLDRLAEKVRARPPASAMKVGLSSSPTIGCCSRRHGNGRPSTGRSRA